MRLRRVPRRVRYLFRYLFRTGPARTGVASRPVQRPFRDLFRPVHSAPMAGSRSAQPIEHEHE